MSRPGSMTLRDMTMLKQDIFSRERAGGFPQAASQPPSMLGGVAQGTTTMRRLSESLQREPGDLDPTSQPMPMDLETIMMMLRQQMGETKDENAALAEGTEGHEAAEDQAETMFIEQILEYNPEVVLMALMNFLKKRTSRE